MWMVLNRIFHTSELLLATCSASRPPMAVPDARTLTIQVLLPDSSLRTLETLIHFRSEGQQGLFFIQIVLCMYIANARCVGLWQGKWLVRDLLVVCRVHGVATYRRRHGVCLSVRLQDCLARFAYAYTS